MTPRHHLLPPHDLPGTSSRVLFDAAGAAHHQCSVPGPAPDVAKTGVTSAQDVAAKSPKLAPDLPLLRAHSEMSGGFVSWTKEAKKLQQ